MTTLIVTTMLILNGLIYKKFPIIDFYFRDINKNIITKTIFIVITFTFLSRPFLIGTIKAYEIITNTGDTKMAIINIIACIILRLIQASGVSSRLICMTLGLNIQYKIKTDSFSEYLYYLQKDTFLSVMTVINGKTKEMFKTTVGIIYLYDELYETYHDKEQILKQLIEHIGATSDHTKEKLINICDTLFELESRGTDEMREKFQMQLVKTYGNLLR